MTNYEYYREQIEKFARLSADFALDNETRKIVPCAGFKCSQCEFNMSTSVYSCENKKLTWADDEYIEPEVDWSKVPINTRIVISNDNTHWYNRYFAKYENGEVYAWEDGRTSYTTDKTTSWEYAKLAENNHEQNVN